MNSRERVQSALEYQPIDRVPFDATLTIGACNRLIEYLKLPVKPLTECNIFTLAFPPTEFLKALSIDCAYIPVKVPSNVKPFHFGEESHTTEFGLIYKKVIQPNGYIDYQTVNAPLAGYTLDDLDEFPWPDPNDDAIYEGLREKAEDLYKHTDLALVGYFGGSMFTLASLMLGVEQWLMDLLLEPEFATAVMKRLEKYFTVLYCRALDECGDYLSFVRIDYDDYGSQKGPLISPKMFHELVLPCVENYYKTIKAKFITKNPHGKLMKHSCGDVFAFIGEFIDLGIDILDPIQTSAPGMNRERLGETYKGKISFHAGIDTQKILPLGTSEDIEAEVRAALQELASPGGYLIGPTHHLQPDVPPENFIALRDAVLKYGKVD